MNADASLQIITTPEQLRSILESLLQDRTAYIMPPELVEIEKLKRLPSLTPQGVSKLYGIPEQTLADWRHYKKGPRYTRRGKRVYYSQKDLVTYFESDKRITYA